MEQKRLAEAVTDYLTYRERRHFAASTCRQDRVLLTRFVHDIGDLQLRNLTPDHLSSWFYGDGGVMSQHDWRGRSKSHTHGSIAPATHNVYRTRLSTFFRFCSVRGWIRKDLLQEVQAIPVPKRIRQQPPPNVLLQMVEEAGNPRDRVYLAIAVNTALRTNEICRIKVGDVNLAQGTLHAVISKIHIEDELPITADLDRELRSWLVEYARALGRPLADEDYLIPVIVARGAMYWTLDVEGKKVMRHHFGTYDPARKITANSERIVKEVMARLGMETHYEGTHTIRRAVARAFFDSMSDDTGYDAALRTTSALLHHQSTATTERYLGLTSEKVRRDAMMTGKPFLSAMVDKSNVTALHAVAR